jgi:hypothetical protein
VIGALADRLHFQPSELWEMTADDLDFWIQQCERLNERARHGR